MLFDVYGANAGYQWLGLLLVFGGLILLNEVARRSRAGGALCRRRRPQTGWGRKAGGTGAYCTPVSSARLK